MINVTILISNLSISHFKMVMFLSSSYGVYVSQFIHFARASSRVADFKTHNKLLSQKLLKQCYRYNKFRKPSLIFIDDTMILDLNSKLDFNLSCTKVFGNLSSMVTWCIN